MYSLYAFSNESRAPEIDTALAVLESEGIPCYAEAIEDAPDDEESSPRYRWRVMVPGKFNMRATSILERDIDNPKFEEIWRVHLEMLSDDELRDARPEFVYCGVFDKVERLNRAYANELERRSLNSQGPVRH